MPESVLTQTMPVVFAGRVCCVAAGLGEAGLLAAEALDEAGLAAGVFAVAGLAVGAGLAAALPVAAVPEGAAGVCFDSEGFLVELESVWSPDCCSAACRVSIPANRNRADNRRSE